MLETIISTLTRPFRAAATPSAPAAPRRGRNVIMTPQVETYSGWSVQQVRDTLDQHEEGDFSVSSQLIDAMGRDDRISGDISSRVSALLGKCGIGFDLVPNEYGNQSRSERYVEMLRRHWWEMAPEVAMKGLLRSAILTGFAFGRPNWRPVGKRGSRMWLPSLTVWPTHTTYFDWSERRYIASDDNGAQHVIQGHEWLIYEPSGERSWMGGVVRALGLGWRMRQFTWRDWARFCERHGLPIIAIKEPTGANDDELVSFYENIRKMGSTGVIQLPQRSPDDGFEMAIHEPKDTSWQSFEAFLKRLDLAVDICLLGQNLTTEVQGGSYAAAQAHMRVRQDFLDGDAETLSTLLREQIIKPWGRLNFEGWDDDDAPWPQWQTGIPEDRQAKAKTFLDASSALTNLQGARVPVDVIRFAEAFEIPLVEDAERLLGEAEQEREQARQSQAQGAGDDGSGGGGSEPGADGDATDEGDEEEDDRSSGTQASANTELASRAVADFVRHVLVGHAHDIRHAVDRSRPEDPHQVYIDKLVDDLGREVALALQPHIDRILAIVDDGPDDYESLKERVVEVYEQADPTELAHVVHGAIVLAGVTGVDSAHDGEA